MASVIYIHTLRDETSGLREAFSDSPKELQQFQDEFIGLRSEWSVLGLGVGRSSMDHVQELRAQISAPRETPSVNPKDVLQLQDDLFAVRCER